LLNSLKKSLLYVLWLYAFWMVFFAISRFVFLVYHKAIFSSFPFLDWVKSLWFGAYMDLSMASYLLVIPLVLWGLKPLLPGNGFIKALGWYQLLMVFFLAILQVSDLEIFKNWGHRIDAAIIPFLAYPEEALASAGSSPFRILLTIVGLTYVVSAMFWSGITKEKIKQLGAETSIYQLPAALFFLGLLILPIRGGIQLSPMNQSSVYFSSHRNLNFSAENAAWVFMNSVIESGNDRNLDQTYIRYPKPETEKLLLELYGQKPGENFPEILNTKRPNIVLIVWESLTAKVVKSFGGKFPSTPNFDAESRNSLRFENYFASGDRSDKGLASLLSGVPAIGRLSIMAQPNQVIKLPFLPRVLKKAGYHSTYLYGGDLEFANMKGFMIEAGFDKLVGKEDFPPNSFPSKWGVHDQFLFEKQLSLAEQEKEPFFHTLFTLSSHEPFEFPGSPSPENQPIDTLLCRSHRYTDACLGQWLERAKKSAWWKNTLVVIVADHGHSFPDPTEDKDPWKFKIPMIWTGGALKDSARMAWTFSGSQTDFAAMLLPQLGLEAKAFHFSRNLLALPKPEFVYFAYRMGNGFYRYASGEAREDSASGNRYQQGVFEAFYKP
jgi:phosphoglycerol transferase MdoB-like AlkP superfamily enzyme